MHGFAWYALGLGTAAVAGVTGGPLGNAFRPVAKTALKSGIMIWSLAPASYR